MVPVEHSNGSKRFDFFSAASKACAKNPALFGCPPRIRTTPSSTHTSDDEKPQSSPSPAPTPPPPSPPNTLPPPPHTAALPSNGIGGGNGAATPISTSVSSSSLSVVATSASPTDTSTNTPTPSPTSVTMDTFSTLLPPSQSLSSPFSHPPATSTSPSPSPIAAATHAKSTNSAPIIGGVVGAILLLLLAAGGVALYKRRQRARDRREWERTHAEIADAVREVDGRSRLELYTSSEELPGYPYEKNSVGFPREKGAPGDMDPLFEKAGSGRAGDVPSHWPSSSI